MYGFNCSGFVALEFYLSDGSKILLDDEGYSTTVSVGDSSFAQIIRKNASCAGYVYVAGWYQTTKPTIEIAGVNSSPTFASAGRDHSSEFLIFHFNNTNIVKSGLGLLIHSGFGVFGLKAYATSIVDGAGSPLTWGDVVAGIVRDTNGTPRNVLANFVL